MIAGQFFYGPYISQRAAIMMACRTWGTPQDCLLVERDHRFYINEGFDSKLGILLHPEDYGAIRLSEHHRVLRETWLPDPDYFSPSALKEARPIDEGCTTLEGRNHRFKTGDLVKVSVNGREYTGKVIGIEHETFLNGPYTNVLYFETRPRDRKESPLYGRVDLNDKANKAIKLDPPDEPGKVSPACLIERNDWHHLLQLAKLVEPILRRGKDKWGKGRSKLIGGIHVEYDRYLAKDDLWIYYIIVRPARGVRLERLAESFHDLQYTTCETFKHEGQVFTVGVIHDEDDWDHALEYSIRRHQVEIRMLAESETN